MNKPIRMISLVVLIALITACAPSVSVTDSPDARSTQVEQTVQARLTAQATAAATLPAGAPPTNTIATEAPTALPTPAQSGAPCTDAATFVTDVTIPDGTVMTPGQTFTKTWRLKNSGTCAWTTSYTFGLEEGPGNAFWTDTLHPLTASVDPGQSVDISVNLTAPTTPGGNYSTDGSIGNYTASYQLRNAMGISFLNFTAVIKVQAQASAVFAVTNVTYTVSTWSDTVNGKQYINCPLITANITANGAGTVEYHWVALDSTRPALTSQLENGVLTFDTAGTQTVTQRVMYREFSGGQGMMYLGDSGGVTIDAPNPQSFGGVFLPVCAAP